MDNRLQNLLTDHQILPGRKGAEDSHFLEGDKLCGAWRTYGILQEDLEELCHHTVMRPFFCEVLGCGFTSSSLLEAEQHYSAFHRFECSICHKHLTTSHLLDLHLCEMHDSFFSIQAAKKPLYRCFVEECKVLSPNGTERMQHCVQIHNYPCDYKYDESRKGKNTSKLKESRLKKKDGVPPKDLTLTSAATTATNRMEVDLTHNTRSAKSTTNSNASHLGGGKRRRGSGLNWYRTGRNVKVVSKNCDIDMHELQDALPEPDVT